MKPLLVIITGVPGSGKTTLAKEIANILKLKHLDKDELTNTLNRKEKYEELKKQAEKNLTKKVGVIIDAPHSQDVQKNNWADHYKELAKKHHAKLKIIRCTATEKTIKKRLSERGYLRDQKKFQNWKTFTKEEPIHLPVPHKGITINQEKTLKENTNKTIQFLKE